MRCAYSTNGKMMNAVLSACLLKPLLFVFVSPQTSHTPFSSTNCEPCSSLYKEQKSIKSSPSLRSVLSILDTDSDTYTCKVYMHRDKQIHRQRARNTRAHLFTESHPPLTLLLFHSIINPICQPLPRFPLSVSHTHTNDSFTIKVWPNFEKQTE